MVLITPVSQQFDLFKPDKIYLIYSSDGHFVQQSGMCRQYAQLFVLFVSFYAFSQQYFSHIGG
jgi:hypothetical protein